MDAGGDEAVQMQMEHYLLRDDGQTSDAIENVTVYIFYLSSEFTFLRTANLYEYVYQRCGVEDSRIRKLPAAFHNMQRLLEHAPEERIVVHYVGHGRGTSTGEWPAVELDAGGRYLDLDLMCRNKFSNTTLILDCSIRLLRKIERLQQLSDFPGARLLIAWKGYNVIASSRKGVPSYFAPASCTLFFAAFELAVANPFDDVRGLADHLDMVLKRVYDAYRIPYDGDRPSFASTVFCESSAPLPDASLLRSHGVSGDCRPSGGDGCVACCGRQQLG